MPLKAAPPSESESVTVSLKLFTTLPVESSAVIVTVVAWPAETELGGAKRRTVKPTGSPQGTDTSRCWPWQSSS